MVSYIMGADKEFVTQLDVGVGLPFKSTHDKKDYRVIKLKNGLTALLISDLHSLQQSQDSAMEVDDMSDSDDDDFESNECEGIADGDEPEDLSNSSEAADHSSGCQKSKYLAAASLCIGVGSFEDLNEIEGLMHFLEHMVFMGSKKYPKENYFDNYIKMHGGNDNAQTDLERTTFYFDVQESYFGKALDVFAQFFISPLMKSEAMQRERKAVHSEFQESLNDDYCRREQLLSSMAKKGHPMSLFSFGNEDTLQAQVSEEELHKKLHFIRSKLYTAQFMTLCVQARETLDKLQDLVVDTFSAIPDSDAKRPTYEQYGLPFEAKNFAKLYKVVPTSDSHTVDITWSLPSMLDKYESKPLHYISHLIGHEGVGSIISYLKKKVWATDICAGNEECGFEHNTTYAIFHIRVQLNNEGFKHVDRVLPVIFQYLNLLKKEKSIEWIFKEIQQMEDLDFQFAEEKIPIENVETLSENMQQYPAEHYLKGANLLLKYSPKLIESCMDLLQPDTCNVMISSKHYETSCQQTEKWFGTKYCSEDIPEDWVKQWRSSPSIPELHMPLPNLFIPDNFDLKIGQNKCQFPIKIDSNEMGELWFKQDFHFKLPRAYCYSYFYLDLGEGPKMSAMLDLFLNLYHQQIMEALYPASMAQYGVGINAAEFGFVVKVTGFNQKLKNLVDLIITEMNKFSSLLTNKQFEEMKKQQLMSYYNAILSPDTFRSDLRLSVLKEFHYQVAQKMKIMEEMTMQDFLDTFVYKIHGQRFIRSLIQGNISEEEAKCIYQMNLGRNLNFVCPEMRVGKLDVGENVIRAEAFNPNSANSSVVNYYQGEQGCLMTEVLNEFVIMAMDEPVFDTLRTKEQLGYYVYCTNRNTYGILGISVTVNTQADKFSVSYIDEKIENFLSEFCETFRVISDEELSLLKTTLQDQKMTLDLTLKEEMERNWVEVVNGEYIFDRFQQQVDLIGKIKREDASLYLRNLISISSRKKLSVQVVGTKNPINDSVPTYQDLLKKEELVTLLKPTDENPQTKNRFVTNLKAFASKLPLFPVTKILKQIRYL